MKRGEMEGMRCAEQRAGGGKQRPRGVVKMKTLYTMVVRRSGDKWVTLCLENGMVGQRASREEAIRHLREAVASFEEAVRAEEDAYSAPVSIRELHEFLTYDVDQPAAERYELCAVYG